MKEIQLKEHPSRSKLGIKYFNGSHPKIRRQYQAGRRPTEFGNKVWATTFRLMEYIEDNSDAFENLRVLEIGCGWGLAGVYLGKIHGCTVTCSDLDPYVLPIVDLHAEVNGVRIQTLEAGFSDLTIEDLGQFDLIIGAEVCYSEVVSNDLFAMLERAFKAGVQKIVIADPGRPDFEDKLKTCQTFCSFRLEKLAGSENGKFTHLFDASPKL